MKYQAVLGFVALTLAVACGSTDKPPALATEPGSGGTGGTSVTHTGGKGGSGGKGGAGGRLGGGGDTSDGGDAGPAPVVGGPLAPIVTITSPVAVKDPNVGPVLINDGVSLVNDTVKVTCTVVGSRSAGAVAVDTSSVKLEMLDDAGASLQSSPGTPTGNNNEYAATFSVAENGTPSVVNGKVSFVCNANDLAKPAHAGTARVDTFVDHGPEIQPGHPVPDSPHPLQGALAVDFAIAPAPLAAGDKGAVVGAVTLQVNGVSIDLGKAADPTAPGHYKLSIDLTDQTIFRPAPNGSTGVSITAKDQRGALRQDTYYFVVDSAGPTITITSPGPGDIIGGKRSLIFVITDQQGGAGVDPNSVVVTVNGKDNLYLKDPLLWVPATTTGTYTFILDSTIIPVGTAQFTVNIRAQDLAGNAASGTSAFYYIDNRPPMIDLDPKNVQELTTQSGAPVCSDPFDPLGPHPAKGDPPNGSAVNDLDVIAPTAVFRALVWDLTNHALGAQVDYFSRVDPASVRLYVQPDPSAGLLVDTNPLDADTTCNDIDSTLVNVLPFVRMDAVAPTGESLSTGVGAIAGTCAAASLNSPDKLCSKTSDLFRVIAHSMLPVGAAPEPVVYTLAMKGVCPGDEWTLSTDATSGIVKQNGWICLAVRAADTVGNFGVSRPLRVCLNNPALGAAPPCANLSDTPPTCVTSCTPPPRIDLGVVDAR